MIQDAELTFQTLTTRKGASELPWKAIRTRPHQQEPIQTSVRKYLPVWLNECFSTHDLLYHTLREPLPKRVIDIGQSSGNSALRLYETKGESERYICLSHCWGDFQPICTTTANINDYKKSISWKSLPKTFQDTVDLARFLNVRYLWIDSLCIIQDDLKDWEREAAEMANIYSKSYLTIAATAAFDCSQGLYSNSTQQITGPHELKVIIDGDREASAYAVALPPHDAYEILGAFLDVGPNFPLLKRAWCFQGHILSPRVIQFGLYEAVFECSAGLKCPCGQVRPNGSPKSGLAKFLQQYQGTRSMDPGELQSVHSAWYDTIVREYAARLLKYSSDRLVALSGVARVFHSAYQSTYLAGLWERDLLSGLCWYLRPSGGELKRRPNEYIAPTWSWASINQPVQWSKCVEFGRFDAEIVQALCTPKTHDPFGAVRDGRITVKSTLVQAEHSTPSSGREHSVAVNGVNKVYYADYPPEGNIQPLASKQTYFLLRLSHAERLKVGVPKNIEPNLRALVLKASGSNYERVGYLEAYGQEVLDWFEGVTEKVVTIV